MQNEDGDLKDFEQASANDALALLGSMSEEKYKYYLELPDRDDTGSKK